MILVGTRWPQKFVLDFLVKFCTYSHHVIHLAFKSTFNNCTLRLQALFFCGMPEGLK